METLETKKTKTQVNLTKKEKAKLLKQVATVRAFGFIRDIYNRSKKFAHVKDVFPSDICNQHNISQAYGNKKLYGEELFNCMQFEKMGKNTFVKWIGEYPDDDFCLKIRFYVKEEKRKDDIERKAKREAEREKNQLELNLKEIQVENGLPPEILKDITKPDSSNGNGTPKQEEDVIVSTSKTNQEKKEDKNDEFRKIYIKLQQEHNKLLEENNKLLKKGNELSVQKIELQKIGNQTLKNIENLYTPYATDQTK